MSTSSVTEKAVLLLLGLFSWTGTAVARGTCEAEACDVLVLSWVPQLGQKLEPMGIESDPQALQTRNVSVMVVLGRVCVCVIDCVCVIVALLCLFSLCVVVVAMDTAGSHYRVAPLLTLPRLETRSQREVASRSIFNPVLVGEFLEGTVQYEYVTNETKSKCSKSLTIVSNIIKESMCRS